MLTFLTLVVMDSFDLLAFRLADEAWMLLQIGLGGYLIGRSAQKIVAGLTIDISLAKELGTLHFKYIHSRANISSNFE